MFTEQARSGAWRRPATRGAETQTAGRQDHNFCYTDKSWRILSAGEAACRPTPRPTSAREVFDTTVTCETVSECWWAGR